MSQSQEIVSRMNQMRSQVWNRIDLSDITIDLDSTVKVLYGNQQGAKKGYNPDSRGKKSYHPLLVFNSNVKELLLGQLRSGDSYSGNGVVECFLDTLKNVIQQRENKKSTKVISSTEIPPKQKSVLDTYDLTQTLDRDSYDAQLKKYQKKLFDIEHQVFLQRIPVVLLYEGWDAGGKGGNIRRLVSSMDPRGYEVIPVAAPNDVEKARHYLWRFWREFPKAGHIVIFDRSWYGRVLVERVEGFCSQTEWQRAYAEINSMESQWARFGAVIFKFWLHIDPDEQLRRFEQRQQTPHKQWKITDEDWRNREKWDQYKQAVDEMLIRTSTPHAPWTVVEANCKLHARIKVLKLVAKTLKAHLNK